MKNNDNPPLCDDLTPSLLFRDEPAPFEVYNGQGQSPLVIVSDHASHRVSRALGHLGLPPEYFNRHIAYDIGTDKITRCLADRLDARAVLAQYSRLVVDLNRHPNDQDCIPDISDQIAIPGNQGLDKTDIAQRIATFHAPYHGAIAQEMKSITERDGRPPVIFSIHSFTPTMNGVDRVWDVGVLWNKDPRMSLALIDYLEGWEGLHIGNNKPYSGQDLAYTVDTHGTEHGIANCALEIRQDHCGSLEEISHWADILADALHHILAIDKMHDIRKY